MSILTGDQLADTLKQLPKDKRMAFVESLGADAVKHIIKNIKQWNRILDELGESVNYDFIKRIIKNGDQLGYVLKGMGSSIPGQLRCMAFVESLGSDAIKHIIKNGNELAFVLFQLPADKQIPFVKSLGDAFIKHAIQNSLQLGKVLGRFYEAAELIPFVKSLGDVFIKGIITNSYPKESAYSKESQSFAYVLGQIPKAKKLPFVKSLSAGLIRYFIQDTEQLRDVLRELPTDEQKMALADILGVDRVTLGNPSTFFGGGLKRHREDDVSQEERERKKPRAEGTS